VSARVAILDAHHELFFGDVVDGIAGYLRGEPVNVIA
jgi:hypothetical protein